MSNEDINETRHNHLKELFERFESQLNDKVEKLERRIDRMETFRKWERLAWVLLGVVVAANPQWLPLIKGL